MPKTTPLSPPQPCEAQISRAERQQRLQESKEDFKKRMEAIEKKFTSVPKESESEPFDTDVPLPSPPHSPPHTTQSVFEEKEAEPIKKDKAQEELAKATEDEENPEPTPTNVEVIQEERLPVNLETTEESEARTQEEEVGSGKELPSPAKATLQQQEELPKPAKAPQQTETPANVAKDTTQEVLP